MTTITARGAIATSHYLATEAGARVIADGGNAIDAALTAAATLCVVYPNNVALGGDLVALVRNPAGEVSFLNATGTAPAHQSLDALRKKHGAQLPLRGIDTITVPGGVRGWQMLHDAGGTRPWADHFTEAIAYARDGFPNSRSVAQALIDDQSTLLQDAGTREIFFPDGIPLPEGAQLLQLALADTLTRIAEAGADEFYAGEVARTWVEGLRSLGSEITLADTAAYAAFWDEPLEGSFGSYRVVTSPPNTSGFMFLRALDAIAQGIDDPLGTGAGELSRAFFEANIVRASWLADPRNGGANGTELVSMRVPADPGTPDAKASGDTVGLSVSTADGWSVSLINSVYWAFGAQILEPRSGVLFQNRGTSFSLDPDSPNSFAPRKRPRHTLMPVLILRENKIAWVPSTMGGSAQPQIHTQLLLRYLAGANPTEAIRAPRWMVDEWTGEAAPRVLIESDTPETTQHAIRAAGFALNLVPPFTEDLGHANLIRVTDDGYEAASDPRSDGSAIVVPALDPTDI